MALPTCIAAIDARFGAISAQIDPANRVLALANFLVELEALMANIAARTAVFFTNRTKDILADCTLAETE